MGQSNNGPSPQATEGQAVKEAIVSNGGIPPIPRWLTCLYAVSVALALAVVWIPAWRTVPARAALAAAAFVGVVSWVRRLRKTRAANVPLEQLHSHAPKLGPSQSFELIALNIVLWCVILAF